MKIPVFIQTTASQCIGEVDVKSPKEFKKAAEKLWASQVWKSPVLCTNCTEEKLDLGEFEIDTNIDFYFEE